MRARAVRGRIATHAILPARIGLDVGLPRIGIPPIGIGVFLSLAGLVIRRGCQAAIRPAAGLRRIARRGLIGTLARNAPVARRVDLGRALYARQVRRSESPPLRSRARCRKSPRLRPPRKCPPLPRQGRRQGQLRA